MMPWFGLLVIEVMRLIPIYFIFIFLAILDKFGTGSCSGMWCTFNHYQVWGSSLICMFFALDFEDSVLCVVLKPLFS